ncbi:MAG: ferritin-like domain-containing protein [Nitrosomonas sp.]|nr:ferritin-like domain-containing protein [Nitrosomonas sp.]MDP1951659.1 ferritin-like domain-containing protein [Nitrosomonas sp.]
MTKSERDSVELGDLGLDQGGHLLVKRALRTVSVGTPIAVYGNAPELAVHLRGWCRAQGHEIEIAKAADGPVAVIRRGGAEVGRWRGAEAAGEAATPENHAHGYWGLAGRSATVEAGAPAFDFPLDTRAEVWAEEAARLYAQAAASQWNPATAISWDEPFELHDEVEDAVVQVMTYLIENETAALVIPARFAALVHPHFREVMQLLAIQAADEARHIEVFTRRALLRRPKLGLSTVGGQSSLKTLIDEPDFALSAMLLSVLGEGSFLTLLWFLQQHAPDPITRQVARLVGQDEARHVAFGVAHLTRHVREDPTLLGRLADAIERRHDVLANTAGLNEEVFDALVLLAAGSWEPMALRDGWKKVQALIADMDQGRVHRLRKVGFDEIAAQALSALHTRNFM